jgi:hypothetical protein
MDAMQVIGVVPDILMGHSWRLLTGLALAWCLALGQAPCAAAESPSLVVEMANGRVFAGRLDAHTTRQTLVILSGTQGMYLRRQIEWSQAKRIRVDGQPMTAAEVLARFGNEGWPRHVEELPVPSVTPSPPAPMPPGPSRPIDADPDDEEPGEPSPLPVASLAIEASVGKWQMGAENDGVLVRIFPMDLYGNIVAVDGILEVEIIGERGTQTQTEPFPELARWTFQVRGQDITARGATYRVPFQALHPEFDLKLGSTGAVHARLSVPGQGMFDDTATMVWLRPLSTTRDRLQHQTGGRFFPTERTNRGMNDSGLPQ